MYRPINDIHRELFGKGLRPATLSLWCTHGRHGFRIPAIRVGAKWHAKTEDYREFLEKSSRKENADTTTPAAPRSKRCRAKSIDAATAALDRMKI